MSAVARFDSGSTRFQAAAMELDTTLSTRHPGQVSERIRMQAGELRNDIHVACSLFRESHLSAVGAAMESAGSVGFELDQSGVQTLESLAHEADRLKLAYKILYYLIRAYQDALYRVLLELLGGSAGKYGSMHKATRRDAASGERLNPVGQLLDSRDPAYLLWFERLREERNRVKEGVNFGTRGDRALGISFSTFTEEGGLVVDLGTSPITPLNVAEALVWSAWLASVALGQAKTLAGSGASR